MIEILLLVQANYSLHGPQLQNDPLLYVKKQQKLHTHTLREREREKKKKKKKKKKEWLMKKRQQVKEEHFKKHPHGL